MFSSRRRSQTPAMKKIASRAKSMRGVARNASTIRDRNSGASVRNCARNAVSCVRHSSHANEYAAASATMSAIVARDSSVTIDDSSSGTALDCRMRPCDSPHECMDDEETDHAAQIAMLKKLG